MNIGWFASFIHLHEKMSLITEFEPTYHSHFEIDHSKAVQLTLTVQRLSHLQWHGSIADATVTQRRKVPAEETPSPEDLSSSLSQFC